jgi:FtsZ-binding cell division protein ZapB
LERVQQQVQQLQKEKERFRNQLEAKRKVSEKLEKLNQAKEQIERMQREIEEVKEQENSSLWQDSPHQNSGQNKRTPNENFFVGNGISQFVEPDLPLSIGLQTAPWPPKFKPLSLPKYNGFGNSIQFLVRYESVVNSVGGDDVALAKSFIIACEGPVLNWHSLLQPHSVNSWVDLKTKFIQAFQIFHETTAQSSELYNCKEKDREPLQNFVRRFMQWRSQIPEADDKTTIQALVKGLTPRLTTSHLTRRKPKSIDELFHEIEEYIMFNEDHRRRVAERNEARQGNRGTVWRPHFQNPRNINNVENPQFDRHNRPSTRGGHAPRGRGRGRGPPKLTNHSPRDPYFYCQYHGRGHNTEGFPETKKNIARIQQEKAMMNIASTMPNQFHPSFWQPQFMGSQPNPVIVQQFQQPQPS